MPELCAVCCTTLSKWNLEKYPGLHSGMPSFQFGRLDEIQARKDCPLCQLLLSLVPLQDPSPIDACNERDATPTLAGQVRNFGHTVGDNDPCDLNVYLNGTMETGIMKGQLLGSLTTKKLWKQDEGELSISSVMQEVLECQTSHRKDSLHSLRKTPWIRIRLIDVLNNNVCEQTIDERFLALSYVWGGIAGFQATKSNREELQAIGSLSDSGQRLPRVIQDAMAVTRKLGERFLWVDSLCIEQDNAVHKAEQIALMDKIYLRSVLTIVALSGQSGHASLPGVQPGTALNPKASATVNGRQLFVCPPSLFETFESSRYESRGWTLQERCLSPRLLIFTHHAWYFHCHSELVSNGLWWQKKSHAGYNSMFETLNLLRCPGQQLTTSHAPSLSIAEFFRYEAVVLIYTARHLSNHSDALHAVSALLAGISSKMRSPFVYGLPERFLGLALLWIPTGHYPANNGPRRVRNTDNEGKALFPSWTWLAWIGQSHYAPGLIMPCFPSQDDVEHWLNGQDPVGFVDDIDSYVLATDDDLDGKRYLNTTKHPTDRTPPSQVDSTVVESVPWTHLVFTAWTADAFQFSLNSASHSQPWSGGSFQNVKFTNWHPTRIMDDKAQHCGCLYEFVEEGFDLQMDLTQCRFIALSSSNSACLAAGACCGPANPVGVKASVQRATAISDWDPTGEWENFKPRHECRVKDFMFDKSCFGRTEWCFINVMLVSWAPGRAERIGVGLIHREAWRAANRKEETVHLY